MHFMPSVCVCVIFRELPPEKSHQKLACHQKSQQLASSNKGSLRYLTYSYSTPIQEPINTRTDQQLVLLIKLPTSWGDWCPKALIQLHTVGIRILHHIQSTWPVRSLLEGTSADLRFSTKLSKGSCSEKRWQVLKPHMFEQSDTWFNDEEKQ